MRKTFVFVVLLLTIYQTSWAQKGNIDPTGDVQQTLVNFFKGISTLDIQQIEKHVTKDFILFEDGQVWNLDTLAAQIEQMQKMGNLQRDDHFEFIKIEINGNMAWGAYHLRADVNFNGQKILLRWLESAVFRKTGTEWKIEMLHSTAIKPAG